MSPRTPLRPLTRVLKARETGENPEGIERENIRLRGEAVRDKVRARAEGRLLMLGAIFVVAFSVVGVRMGMLAATPPTEPEIVTGAKTIVAGRADITDRKGRILATNLLTHALYAQPRLMVDPDHVADSLVQIFPDLDAEKLRADFTGKKQFVWIKKKMSPEQMQMVHDIGDPGLLFGPREMRLYPNGALAAHILGGARFGTEGVDSAEILGVAGVEKAFDNWLRDPAQGGAPLALSLDLTVQSVVEEVLDGGMTLMNAKGATAILMEVQTGEIVAMASLPDFDPNDRPAPLTKGDASDSPLFNRAVQGLYELGSTFKVFAIAQGMELGLVNPNSMVATQSPMTYGRFKIRDSHNYGAQLSVTDIIVKSSNIGTARVAMMVGPERQKAFLKTLGFLEPTKIEMVEAPTGKPLIPKKWSEISSLTISYGHGLSASPLHLAQGYATLANGGHKVTPTLIHSTAPRPMGEQVISTGVAQETMRMMRQVVTRGTASFGDVKGYEVAGKTGTADKAKPTGGYYKDKVIATFAGAFPVSDPKYVLVLTLDEPVETSGDEPRRTAGWTAVPVAAEVIRRTAPLLGLRPTEVQEAVTLTSN